MAIIFDAFGVFMSYCFVILVAKVLCDIVVTAFTKGWQS